MRMTSFEHDNVQTAGKHYLATYIAYSQKHDAVCDVVQLIVAHSTNKGMYVLQLASHSFNTTAGIM